MRHDVICQDCGVKHRVEWTTRKISVCPNCWDCWVITVDESKASPQKTLEDFC